MNQNRVGIVIGITFIILGLMLQPASAGELEYDPVKIYAYQGDKNSTFGLEPAMCSAIFVTAMDQYVFNIVEGDSSRQTQTQMELYSTLTKIFNWARERDNINIAAYFHQVEFYMENMDTATALLHYDRCWYEGIALYGEYRSGLNN